MRNILSVFLVFIVSLAHSQHCMDYSFLGEDQITFISKNQLLEMDPSFEICEVFQYPQGETGGMHNNWSMVTYQINSFEYVFNWYPLYKDSNYQFSWDDILEGERPLNGSAADFDENNQLVSFGGFGYGSFDHSEYLSINDSVKAVLTSCIGHCGNFDSVSLSFNIYRDELLVYHLDVNTSISWEASDSTILSIWENAKHSTGADTSFYSYTSEGHYVPESMTDLSAKNILKFFSTPSSPKNPFDGIFVKQISLKHWALKHLEGTPQILSFEIYKYGALFFSFDHEKDQYVLSREIILG